MNYNEAIDRINKAFGETSGHSREYRERLSELERIFSAQVSSLRRIRESGFFETLSNSFWNAICVYLELAQFARNSGRFAELINDSYIFIKSFDNALQGYLNSDRLFLEFPGHSISLYDLPAKLGVVYVQFIEMIVNSLNGPSGSCVAFLLCPEPFEEEGIHVMRLLYSESAKKEILVIEAPRNMMFEPDSFLFALAHEIAHYVDTQHRRLVGSDMPRNTMLRDLHEEEFIIKCKEGLCLALDECYDEATATRVSNIFKRKIDAENSTIKQNIKRNAPVPNENTSFTEMERFLIEHYTNPLLRATELRICEVVNPGALDGHGLNDQEQIKFINEVRIRMSEYAISLLIEASETALYITKEGAADAAAIKLLGMSRDDYISKILTEHARIFNNRNLKIYLLMRANLVCLACFGEEFKLMQKYDENGNSLVLPYDEELFIAGKYEYMDHIISNHSDELIVQYICTVYETVGVNEKLATLYSNSRKEKLDPHALFKDYML